MKHICVFLGFLSNAAQGNFLEVLNMSLNTFENHYLNRKLDRSGQQCIVITPGIFSILKNVYIFFRFFSNMNKKKILVASCRLTIFYFDLLLELFYFNICVNYITLYVFLLFLFLILISLSYFLSLPLFRVSNFLSLYLEFSLPYLYKRTTLKLHFLFLSVPKRCTQTSTTP